MTHENNAGELIQAICPQCGSAYFTIRNSSPRKVFSVSLTKEITFLRPEELNSDTAAKEEISRSIVQCGACSWHGSIDELRFS